MKEVHGVPIVDASVPGFIEHLEHAMSPPNNPRDRNRPYNGQAHTFKGERGQQVVHGITMRDVFDCVLISCPEGDIDPEVAAQNTSCLIEKRMGIFPNLPKGCVTSEELISDMVDSCEASEV